MSAFLNRLSSVSLTPQTIIAASVVVFCWLISCRNWRPVWKQLCSSCFKGFWSLWCRRTCVPSHYPSLHLKCEKHHTGSKEGRGGEGRGPTHCFLELWVWNSTTIRLRLNLCWLNYTEIRERTVGLDNRVPLSKCQISKTLLTNPTRRWQRPSLHRPCMWW